MKEQQQFLELLPCCPHMRSRCKLASASRREQCPPGSRRTLLPLVCQVQLEPPSVVFCLWAGWFLNNLSTIIFWTWCVYRSSIIKAYQLREFFSRTLRVVSNFGIGCMAINTSFTAIPLTCMYPVFENCKIRMKFQKISEKL